MPSRIDHVIAAAAEDTLRGQGIGDTAFGDAIWIDERATLSVSLALTSAQ